MEGKFEIGKTYTVYTMSGTKHTFEVTKRKNGFIIGIKDNKKEKGYAIQYTSGAIGKIEVIDIDKRYKLLISAE